MASMNTNELLENILLLNKAKETSGEAGSPEYELNLTPEQIEMISKMYAAESAPGQAKVKEKDCKSFLPQPGFCLKTKNEKNDKIFLNICHSKEINAPIDISEAELRRLIEQIDSGNAAFQYRVPMSLGEAHSEVDNSANACIAYDVCINTEFMNKVLSTDVFMGFLISIVLEGLEAKYSMTLDRECKLLKNKKFMGKIQEQLIRTKSKPLISEVTENPNTKLDQKEKRLEVPKYRIIREPAEGQAEFLVAEIELPNIISSHSLMLDIGEDRILLNTRTGLYVLDIYLPFNLKQEDCGAQFDKKTKVLTITMPVVAS